ncbi:MAG TPA: hypothetical protein VL358_04735 [Caulobacteraceae bacterium]|nr:hypothetical protein [Caulobacteraceae bacterium]
MSGVVVQLRPAEAVAPVAPAGSGDPALVAECMRQAVLFMQRSMTISALIAEVASQPVGLTVEEGGARKASAGAAMLADAFEFLNLQLPAIEAELRRMAGPEWSA